MSNTGQAWVTLATNDSYALGALVLAQSLKRSNTIHQLAILVTPGVSSAMREALTSAFDCLKEVDVLDSKDSANLALLARPDLGITFTKLHCWTLTQYTKCVFLDADTLVVKNADELFEREELSAAPDAGWPDCFNSGVFVYKPSEDTYKALLDFALANGSFDGGDQGLLNMFFSDWATKDITKHLPFIYNVVANATYSYLPAFKMYGSRVKIAHFIGSSKPWLQAQPGSTTLSEFLNLWWNIFLTDVSQKLNTEMIINSTVFEEGPRTTKSFSTPPPPPPPTVQRHVFVDPWDYIQSTQAPPRPDSTFNTEDVIDRLVEHLKETQKEHNRSEYKQTNKPTTVQYAKQFSAPNLSGDSQHHKAEANQNYSNILSEQRQKTKSLQHLQPRHLQNHYGQLYTQKEDIREEPLRRAESYENIPTTISPPFSPSCVEQNFQSKIEEPQEVQNEGGLAGALAGGQKDVIEDQWRKQSWEQGNIDYMGVDAFENIWKKIADTVKGEIKPIEEPVAAPVEEKPSGIPEKTEDKTDALETKQPEEEVKPVQPAAPVEPVASTEPAAPANPAELVEPVASTEPAAPAKPAELVEPVASTEPAALAKPAELVEPAALTEPPAAPAEPVAPVEVVPAEPAASTETAAPATQADGLTAPGAEEPTKETIPPPGPAEQVPVPPEVTVQAVPATVIEEPSAPTTEPTAGQGQEAAKEASQEAAAPVIPPQPSPATPPAEPASAAPVEPPTQPPASEPAAPPQPTGKKFPSPPKDDPPPPEPPKDGGAEKVAVEPSSPTSPSVPSPDSPSAPEGTTVGVQPQSPPAPSDPATPTAETSTPPQTPTGEAAPVPPKRRSTKGKGKK